MFASTNTYYGGNGGKLLAPPPILGAYNSRIVCPAWAVDYYDYKDTDFADYMPVWISLAHFLISLIPNIIPIISFLLTTATTAHTRRIAYLIYQ